MKQPTPTGSQIREKFNPKFDQMVEGLTAEVEADEALPRRIARAFLRYAARVAANLSLPEQVFLTEAHEAFHVEQSAKKEKEEGATQAPAEA